MESDLIIITLLHYPITALSALFSHRITQRQKHSTL